MPIIDFRLRAPYQNNWDSFYTEDGQLILPSVYQEYGLSYHGSVVTGSLDDLLDELQETDVVKAVLPAREVGGLDNEGVFELAAQYPDLFLPFPYIQPRNREQAVEIIHQYLESGRSRGVVMEPNFGSQYAYRIDDTAFDPIYEQLQELEAVVLLTLSAHGFGGVHRDQPEQLDRLAARFPRLPIVAVHGGWPFTLETIAVAMNRPNVYLAPDIYATNNPGGEDYWKAARTVLQDKILFATSYPGMTIPDAVAFAREKLGTREDIERKIFYDNAARILNL